MKIGIETLFSLVNDTGAINGRQLKLFSADDGYEPGRTGAAMQQLWENDHVFGIVGNVGTPTAVVALPFAVIIQGMSTVLWRKGLGQRIAPVVAGASGTTLWLALLRFAPRFCWISPALPWLLIVLTVVVFLGIERRYCHYPEDAVLNEDAGLNVISATAD